MKLRINAKLRAALIAAITVVGFTLSQAQAESTYTIITFAPDGDTSSWADYNIPLSYYPQSSTLPQGPVVTNQAVGDSGITYSVNFLNGGGRVDANYALEMAGWTNQTAINEMNTTMGTELTTTLLGQCRFLYGKQAGRKINEVFNFTTATAQDEKIQNGDTVTFYVGITNESDTANSSAAGFTMSGMEAGTTYTYATATGDGFGSEAYSANRRTLTIVKVVGTVEDATALTFTATGGDKNGLAFIAYDAVASAPIATYIWKGQVGSKWSDSVWNDSEAFVPSSNAQFDASGYTTVIVDSAVEAKNVTVDSAAYTFNLAGGNLTAGTLAVSGDGAALTITGAGTVAVKGSVTLGEGTGITVGENSTLKVGSGQKELMMGTAVDNKGTFVLTTNVSLGNGESTRMGGTLAIQGATVTLGTGEGTTASIASFSHVSLDGAQITVNAQDAAINGVSVATDKNGTIKVEDMQNHPKTVALNGVTRVDGTLNLTNNWNSSFTIEQLSGAGTLNQPAGGQQEMILTINSLKDFTGSIILKHNQNKDAININTGTTAVNFNTLELAIGGHTANFTLGADTGITLVKLTSGTLALSGADTHTLTLGGLEGGATITGLNDLTLDVTAGSHAYTGTLTVAGKITKTGAGSQTINGYTMHKGIDVQAGTLVLNGTYDITNLEMDPGVTYSYQDDQKQESTAEVGGFRATNGSMTVYTKGDTATVTDNGTYMLDGKQVTLTDGKFNFEPEADLTTLWVNGSTPLSYDAYYAASGEETKALTTAKVAGGATLTVGANAVGTLAYQTDGTTINLGGTGTVNAISGTGTLNLLEGAEVTYNIPGGSANFTTTGEGTLKSAGFTLNGGTVTLGSDAALSSQVNLYSGKFIIGGDTDIDATLNLGESYGNTAEVTVNEGAKLTVNAISSAWGFRSITVNGVLNVEGELRLSTGNQHYTINGSGTVNTNKLTLANVGNYHIDGTDGLTLAVGEGGIAKGGTSFTVKNLKVQATADWTTAQNTALDGTLTMDTNSHNVTISSVLSNASGATGSVTKTGAGTLTLSGANTYTGATTVEAGVLKATHLGSGDITVNAGATLDLTGASAITTTGNLTLGNGSTLVLAGENMLSVGTLALAEGTTALTLNLDNIVPATAHTVVLATGTTVAPLDDVTVNVVWNTLPEYLKQGSVQVQDNSWVITLTSLGQELIWDGGEAVWSSEVQHWHAEGTPETHVGFNNGDKAIFGASETPAVANLTGAVSTQSMTVAAGADVTVQAAAESTGAALAPVVLKIAGTLATSVDTTATSVEASGANAAWNITGGNVVADTITAAEGAEFALAISNGASLAAGNVTGAGSVSVAGSLNAGKATIAAGDTLSLGATGEIAIGTSATKGDATLNGAGTLALTGGTVTIHGTNKDSFTGNVDVQAGTLKLGESTGDKFVLGAYNYNTARTITIHTDATIDLNGQADGNYVYTLDGGRLTNTGNGIGDSNSQTVGLKLTADSYVGGEGSKEFWLRQRSAVSGSPTSIELNEYSLTKQGGSTFGLFNTAVTGTGSLVVEGGTVNFNSGSSIASNVVLDGGSVTGTLNLAGDVTITAKQDYTMGATVNVGTHTLTLATDEGKAISYSAKYEHGTAGTINADGTVNYAQGLTVNAGTVNVAGIVSVDAHSLDLSNGSTSTGKVNVAGTGVLNVNAGMWMNTNAIDIAEGGTVNIAGLQIIGQTGGASIATTVPNQQYGTDNDKYTITNATVNVNGNVTLGNTLDGVDVVVAKGGVLTLNETAVANSVTVDDGGTIAGGVDAKDVGIVAQGTATFDEGIHEAGISIEGWNSGATVKNTGDTTAKYTGLQDSSMKVTADTLYALNEEAVVIDNALEVGIIMHDGTAALTLTKVNAEVLEGVYANAGTISLQNTQAVSLTEMEIASGSTVQVTYTDELTTVQEGSITITETLVAGGATLLANLTIADGNPEDGVTPLLDVNGGGDNALTLGSQFTIAEGTLVTLDAETIAVLEGMQIGQSLDIIRALEETGLTYGEDGQAIYDGMWFDGLFARTTGVEGDYLVYATGESFGLTKVSNTPEPTTGTLSLLALAALAARRRKHN